MASNTVNFLANAAGTDPTSLALKVYSGVFSEAWRTIPKLFNRPTPGIHRNVDASRSKSYQWLKFADTPTADEDYRPGDELLGQGFAVDEGTNAVDTGYIVTHHKISRYDQKISHFDIMSKLANADARQISMVGEKRLLITSALAARTASSSKLGLTIDNGGNRVIRTGGATAGTNGVTALASAYPLSATGAANYRADLRALAYAMDLDNIPREGRELWHTPYMEQVLMFDTTAQLFSKDYTYDGEGNKINERMIKTVEGFKIIDNINPASNGAGGAMPDSNITTGPTRYQGNFLPQAGATNGMPVALVFSRALDGAGAVSIGTWDQVGHVVKYREETMDWFVSSGLLSGMSIMAPPCAGSVEVALT